MSETKLKGNFWGHLELEVFMINCVFPSEEFELKANSLGAHIETQGKLILRTLSYLTLDSQDELTPWACCELFMRLPDELTMQW